jgi:hypothetical protein
MNALQAGSGDSGAEPSRAPLTLSALLAGTTGVALVLLALQQSLRLPAAWGIEDWLGWADAAAVVAAVQGWCLRPQQLVPAAAYLYIDQVLFMPLYAALTLAAAARLRAALAPGLAERGRQLRTLLGPVLWVVLLALLLADTVENAVGLFNLGQPLHGVAMAGVGTLCFAAWLTRGWRPPWPWLRPLRALEGMGAFVGTALLAWLLALAVAVAGCADVTEPLTSLTVAHQLKLGLSVAMVALPLLGAVAWCFGFELDPQSQARARDDRATWRTLVSGVVGRSRYVLVIIAVYGALTLGLDQCRDVLLALAHLPDLGLEFWAVRLPVLLLGPLAAALFAHSCWLWARLAGMVQRPGVVLPDDAATRQAVGRFARHWARALAVLPLLMVALLVALALGDLALAAGAAVERSPVGHGGGTLLRTGLSALLLVGFALGAMGIAGLLLRARRRAQKNDMAAYYNSEPDVWALLWYHSGRVTEGGPAAPWYRRAAAVVTRPWLLPMVALLAMATVRVLMATVPGAVAPSPPTLVLLMLALTWWLGVLGLLSLWEQKHSLPWIALPLLAVGALSAMGLTDNHALWWPAPLDVAALRADGRAAIGLLVLCGLGCWWVAVADPDHWARTVRLRRRWPVVAGVLAVTLGGLWHLDHQPSKLAVHRPQAPSAAEAGPGVPAPDRSASAPQLAERLSAWVDQAAASGLAPGPLYFVAAEGGGIRSAYWTAQVLAALGAAAERSAPGGAPAALPEFDRRTVLMSGVSGGSMGLALHRACRRQAAAMGRTVADCIDAGFDQLDALSPLLGGLFFEDVFARLLPLSRRSGQGLGSVGCTQPGCAHVDRAALFEREWMRVFPPLAQPLQAALPAEPLLAFNSTWVETGNRTVASNWALPADAYPAAQQLHRCLGADTRLVSAAHTSARFPVTNPLAGVQPVGEAAPDCRAGGHLIDGGYFDNSALPTVLDALRALAPRLQATGWKPVVVMIRNGRRPRHCEIGPGGVPPPRCVLPPTGVLTDPRTLDQAGDRQGLTLYADLLGPALALLNVSGVGAHGRDAAAALRGMLGEHGRGCDESAIRLIDQVDDGSLVPLGWYLSPAARQSLQHQVALRVPGRC